MRKIFSVALAAVMLTAVVPSVHAATVASGGAGYNAEWVFDDTGTMTISGTGNMYNSQIGNTYAHQVGEIIIKNGITGIGASSFYEPWYAERRYTNTKNIEIPTSVKTIGNKAFQYCTALRTINLPSSITSIGDEAFRECFALITFTMPENITWINKQTFQACSSLRTIYLPSGITEIEENAFDGCNALTDVFFAGSAEEWNNIIIGKGNAKLTGATIHYNNAEGEYPYEISALTMKSNSGEYITAVPENESFIINVDITERLSRNSRDYALVAFYDTSDHLIGINYIRADFSASHGCEFGINVPPQPQKIGSIKAFMWSDFKDITPLCESKTITL